MIKYVLMLGVDVPNEVYVKERLCIIEAGPFDTWQDAHDAGLRSLGKVAWEAWNRLTLDGHTPEEYDTSLALDGHRYVVGFSVEAFDEYGTTHTTNTGMRNRS